MLWFFYLVYECHHVFRLIFKFRFWLDAARLLFLLIAHIGKLLPFHGDSRTSQTLFLRPCGGFHFLCCETAMPPRRYVPVCVNQCTWSYSSSYYPGTDEEGICEMLNVYITIASWVVPLLCKCGGRCIMQMEIDSLNYDIVLIYSLILGVVAYRHRHDPSEEDSDVSEKVSKLDLEKTIMPRQSTLPMMPPPQSPFPFRDRHSFSSHRAGHRVSTQPSTFGASSRVSTSQVSRPTSQAQRHLSIIPIPAMPPVRQVPAPTTPAERHRSRTLSLTIPSIPDSPLKTPVSTNSERLSKPAPSPQLQWTWEAI